MIEAFNTQCSPALDKCDATGRDADYSAADDACYSAVEGPLSDVQNCVYNIRGLAYAPPSYYIDWLSHNQDAVGNKTAYKASNDDIFNRSISTGNGKSRTTSPHPSVRKTKLT